MEVHEIEMRGLITLENKTTAEAGVAAANPPTEDGGQLFYWDLGYIAYYDDNANEWQVLCTYDDFDAHVYSPNPHSNSASNTDLNDHIYNTSDPHDTSNFLLDVTNGMAFVQEEDSFLIESLSDGQYIIYFYRQYAMGSVSYGTDEARGNTQVQFVGWERNVDDYIIGFKIWVRNMQNSDEEIYYSMFGITGVDPADCNINTGGGSSSWTCVDAGCTCESECTSDCADCTDCSTYCSDCADCTDYPGCGYLR